MAEQFKNKGILEFEGEETGEVGSSGCNEKKAGVMSEVGALKLSEEAGETSVVGLDASSTSSFAFSFPPPSTTTTPCVYCFHFGV